MSYVGLGGEQLWLCPTLDNSTNDISGNGNNGTLTGGTEIVSDAGSGGTMSFEAFTTPNDTVSIPAGVLADGSDVSVSVWVKNKQTSAGTKVRNIVRTINNDLKIYAYQDKYVGSAVGAAAVDQLGGLNTTEYYNYVLNYSYATSSVELFRNGVSVGSATNASAITVSGAMDVLQNSIGFVDDLRAYNRQLTQAEITYLATARGVQGSPSSGIGPNPVGPEVSWICPSLNPSQSGSPEELMRGVPIITTSPTAPVWTPDTSDGGSYSVSGDFSERKFNSLLNVSPTRSIGSAGISFWAKFDISASSTTGNMKLFDLSSADSFGLYVDCRFDAGIDIGGGTLIGCDASFTFVGIASSSEVIVSPIKLTQNSSSTSSTAWEEYWNQWRHYYINFDMPRAAGTTDYSLFAPTPYFEFAIDGEVVDSSTTTIWGAPNVYGSSGIGSPTSATVSDDSVGGMKDTPYWDDNRFFLDTLPTPDELAILASARAVEGESTGPVEPPVGVGGETMWVCPTLSVDNGLDDLTGNDNSAPATLGDNISIVSDSGEGGSHALKWGVGSNPVMTMDDGPNNSGQSEGAFSCWIKSETTSNVGISGFTASNTSQVAFGLAQLGSGPILIKHNVPYGSSSQFSAVNSGPNLPVNDATWHHIAMSWKSETYPILYVDGVAHAFTSKTGAFGPVTTTTMDSFEGELGTLGGLYEINNGNMSVDDFRTFNRELDQGDIDNLSSVRGFTSSGGSGGLGTEGFWVCPSEDDSKLDQSGLNNYASTNPALIQAASQSDAEWTSNTEYGGRFLIGGTGPKDDSGWSAQDVFGSKVSSVDKFSVSCWIDFPADLGSNHSTYNGNIWLIGEEDVANGIQFSISWSSSNFDDGFFQAGLVNPDFSNYWVSYQGWSGISSQMTGIAGVRHVVFLIDNTLPDNNGANSKFKVLIDGTRIDQALSVGTGQNYNQEPTTFDTPTSIVSYQGKASLLSSVQSQFKMDDCRVFNGTLTSDEIALLGSERGYGFGGSPEPDESPEGIGDEKLWYCPTLDDSADDLSGNGNNGAYKFGMGTTDSTGDGGTKAFSFDGTSQYIETQDSASIEINPADGFGFSVWINPDNLSGGDTFSTTNPRQIIQKGASVNNMAYGVRCLGNKLSFLFRNSTDTAYVQVDQVTGSLTENSWQCISVTGDSSGYSLFVDGVEVPSTVTGNVSDDAYPDSTILKSGMEDNRRYYSGLTDDMRIFGRVLSETEIEHLASYRGVTGPPTEGDEMYNPFTSYAFNANKGQRIR